MMQKTRTLKRCAASFIKEMRGAALPEYSVLIGMIAGLVVAIIAAIGVGLANDWDDVSGTLVATSGPLGGSSGGSGPEGAGGGGPASGGSGGGGSGGGGSGGSGSGGGGPLAGNSGGGASSGDGPGGGAGPAIVAGGGAGSGGAGSGSGSDGSASGGGGPATVAGGGAGSVSGFGGGPGGGPGGGSGQSSIGGAGAIQLASAESQSSGPQSLGAAGGQSASVASTLSFSDAPAGAAAGRVGSGGSEPAAPSEQDLIPATAGDAGEGQQQDPGLADGVVAVIAELFAIEPAAGSEGGAEKIAYRSAIVTETAELPRGNRAPVASDDHYRVLRGASLYVPVGQGALLNDRDPDGDALTAVLAKDGSAPQALFFRKDGTLLIAAAQISGSLELRYRAFDGALYSEIATITIEVVER